MKTKLLILLPFLMVSAGWCQTITGKEIVIGKGKMPQVAKDADGNIHVVYGTGDSIMYSASFNRGRTFSPPQLVGVLPKVFARATRGPQIACCANGIMITANTSYGNMYAYHKERSGSWSKPVQVNDVDSTSKEALMALAADGLNAFAVWLDTRSNGGKGQRLFGARSTDGGKTWSKNVLVYASPDKTICECCKPSVVMKGNKVYAMFRNWINGSRDLYLISSNDGGNTFGKAQKLGTGTWKLNGCPMDGGRLAIDKDGRVMTVWQREGRIYSAEPGGPETELGEGRGCSVETVNGKNVFSWSHNGKISILKPGGRFEVLGAGSLPLLKAVNNEQVVCVWENENDIRAQLIAL